MLEFALAWAVLFPVMGGVYQFGNNTAQASANSSMA